VLITMFVEIVTWSSTSLSCVHITRNYFSVTMIMLSHSQSWTRVGSIHGSDWVGSWFSPYLAGPVNVWDTLDDTAYHTKCNWKVYIACSEFGACSSSDVVGKLPVNML